MSSNQTAPYENGTKVLYGPFDHNHNLLDMDLEAEIIGYTHMTFVKGETDTLCYVLQAPTEHSPVKYFIRTHSQVRLDTSLEQYIGDYIEEELADSYPWNPFDIRLIGRLGQLRCWIKSATEAYEGGAR